jgi:multisubunit Na+/H+ antiporter MnhG subunit
MQVLDVLAAILVLGAAAAFVLGAIALTRANDVEAFYMLVIGVVALRAGVQIVRPGASA